MLGKNRDAFEPEDDLVVTGRKESNFTVLTINEIMEEQMSQINRVAELFEVREMRSTSISIKILVLVFLGFIYIAVSFKSGN